MYIKYVYIICIYNMCIYIVHIYIYIHIMDSYTLCTVYDMDLWY